MIKLILVFRMRTMRNIAVFSTIVVTLSSCGSTAQWPSDIEEWPVDIENGELNADFDDAYEPPADTHNQDGTGMDGSAAALEKKLDAAGQKLRNPINENEKRISISSRGTTEVGRGEGYGYNSREVFIGYPTINGADQVAGQFGVGLSYGPDQESIGQAMVDEINRNGGIRGRQVVPVFHDINTSQYIQNPSSAAQSACAAWTEDRKVFAVIGVVSFGTGGNEVLQRCLMRRGSLYISVPYAPDLRRSSEFERLLPYLYSPTEPTLENLVSVWIRRAKANNYFTSWNTLQGESGGGNAVRIGVIGSEGLNGQELISITANELARHGLSLTASANIRSGATKSQEDVQRAVLLFQQERVSHVIFGTVGVLFYEAAESQSYRPRYSVSSMSQPSAVSNRAPGRQLVGALGVGFSPTIDVGSQHFPEPSRAESRCRDLMRKAGEDDSKQNRYGLMVSACDGFNFLDLTTSHGAMSPEGVRSGARNAKSMPAASTFATSFERQYYAGAAAASDLEFRSDCRCFVYKNFTLHAM